MVKTLITNFYLLKKQSDIIEWLVKNIFNNIYFLFSLDKIKFVII